MHAFDGSTEEKFKRRNVNNEFIQRESMNLNIK
jgi:hypothetical protein